MKGSFKASHAGQAWGEPRQVAGQLKKGDLTVDLDGQTHTLSCRVNGNTATCRQDDKFFRLRWTSSPEGVWVTVRGRTWLFQKFSQADSHEDSEASLSSPMPASVVEVLVNNGDTVEEGQILLRLEAMKMELAIKSPADGVVSDIQLKAGDRVDAGVPLAQIT